ncbi:MAG: PAS domain S-box protein [Terriglobales bacterium]
MLNATAEPVAAPGAPQNASDGALAVAPLNPKLLARIQGLADWAGFAAAALGAIGLLGWVLGNETLKSVLPGHVSMKANTALGFVLSGLSIRLLRSEGRGLRVRCGQVFAAVITAVGVATLAEYIFALDLHIDQSLFHEPAGTIGTASPGRMAVNAALNFVLLGTALLLLRRETARKRHVTDLLALTAAVISVLALLGYLFGVSSLYGFASYTQVALPTAVAFVVLSVGVLAAAADWGWASHLASDGLGGFTLRRLLPLALLLAPLFGWAVASPEKHGWYDSPMGHALFVLGLMVILGTVVVRNARTLDKIDAHRRRSETLLRRSRDQWELTFNCMTEGLSYHAPDYTVLGGNEAFFALLGPDRLPGTKCYEVVHGTQCPPDYCPMQRTLASGRTESGEFFEPRLRRYLSVRTDPVLDAEGKITRIVHVVQDVTERKLADADIHRLAEIVESTDDAIIATDLEGKVIAWNRGAEKMYGYTRAEMVGQDIAITCPPELRHEVADELRQLRAGRRVQSFETRRVRKDGAMMEVSLTISPLVDASGQVTGTSAIARDITERKRAELEIQRRGREAEEARMRLNAVVSSVGEGLYHLDQDGRLVFMNAAAERMLGYRLQEIRGCNMHDLVHSRLPDGTERHPEDCGLLGVIRLGEPYHTSEDYFQRSDGSFIPVEYTSAPLLLEGKVAGAVLSFRDIGERQRAERERTDLLHREQQARREVEAKNAEIAQLNAELEERVRQRTAELEISNRELEAFSYSVSHDLRAPLRSIDGFSQILLDEYSDKLDQEGRAFLGRVRAASQHMGQLIDALLQLSRVTRSEMRHDRVDLSGVVRSIAESLRQSAPQRQVEFRIADGLVVSADSHLLQVALENLLGNAFKFTMRCEHAEIEFGARIENNETVYFVRDNGAGFDMAYAHKLFGAFQRLHGVTEFEGSGIGLATVERIIRRHGGRIWADSQVGEGATFYFTLAPPKPQQPHH